MIPLLAVALTLAAAATPGCDPGDWQCSLPGQDIQVVIDRLGHPTSQRRTGDDTVYLWREGSHQTNPHCFLEFVAGPDHVIKSVNQDETNSGCAAFDKALSR